MDGAANSIAHLPGATLDGQHDSKVSRAPRQSWTVSPALSLKHISNANTPSTTHSRRAFSISRQARETWQCCCSQCFSVFQSLCLSTSLCGGDSPVGVPCQIQNRHAIGQIIGRRPIRATAIWVQPGWMVANRDLERPKMNSSTIEVTITSKESIRMSYPVVCTCILTLISQEGGDRGVCWER